MSHPQSQFMVETTPSAPTSIPVHTHCAKIDRAGNGFTSVDMGHQHQVVGGYAQASPDGHMHGMTQGMCRHDPKRSWGKAGCGSCGKR